MHNHPAYHEYQDYLEYHGNTAVELTRKKGRTIISREWIYFDTVEDAQIFFNAYLGEGGSHA